MTPWSNGGSSHWSTKPGDIFSVPMSDRRRLRHYLLIFDRRKGALVQDPPKEFEDGKVAMEEYFSAEKELGSEFEVLLVASESLAAVRTTHASFFGRADEIEGREIYRKLDGAAG